MTLFEICFKIDRDRDRLQSEFTH